MAVSIPPKRKPPQWFSLSFKELKLEKLKISKRLPIWVEMPSRDRKNFSKLDQLSEEGESEVAKGDVVAADDSRNCDATRAQDMVDQLCEKITQIIEIFTLIHPIVQKFQRKRKLEAIVQSKFEFLYNRLQRK